MMSRSLLMLIMGLSSLTLCGYSCGGFGNNVAPPGETISSVVGENADPIQQSNQIADGCSTTNATPATTWQVNYTDGTTGTVMFTWPKYVQNGNVAKIYYYFDPIIPSNVEQDGLQAINAWNGALQRDKSTGGYVQIALAQGDVNSAVEIYGSNDQPGNMSIGKYEGGDTVIADIPDPYDEITRVTLLMNNALPDNYIYASYLHELGHSLGLNHNQHQGSVMWPTVSNCFTKGGQPLPPKADTLYLEQTYDPELVLTTKSYTTVGCPWGSFKYDPGQTDYFGSEVPAYTLETWNVKKPAGPCPVRAQHASVDHGGLGTAGKALPDMAMSRNVNPMNRSRAIGYADRSRSSSVTNAKAIFGRYARSVLGPSYHLPLLLDLDDHSEAATMSLSSLYLASTLVVAVNVGPVVLYHKDGPTRLAIREAKVSAILRHDLGPDASHKVGDTIYIADYEGAKGEAFIDDLPLTQGRNTVVFLRTANLGIRNLSPGASYQFTTPHISKMVLDSRGRLSPYSLYDADVNVELEQSVGKSISALLRENPMNESTVEDALLGNMLGRRGITSPVAIRNYVRSMRSNSHDALSWARRTQGQIR